MYIYLKDISYIVFYVALHFFSYNAYLYEGGLAVRRKGVRVMEFGMKVRRRPEFEQINEKIVHTLRNFENSEGTKGRALLFPFTL